MTAEPPADPRCGTPAGYQAHHKRGEPTCPDCRAAEAADRRRRVAHHYLTRGQKLMVDATGTRRRIQALSVMGWPLKELAARLGVSHQNVYDYMHRPNVRRSTADRIAALYDELAMLPGPSSSAAIRAKRKGWAPPLAYDEDTIDDPNARPAMPADSPVIDEVAVQRAMRGYPVELRPAERAEAVRRLTDDLHLSSAEIADRLSITKRSVIRLRNPSTAA